MPSNLPKRHHYVPRCILRRFSEDEHLYLMIKKSGGSIINTHIDNVFVKKHLHTKIEKDGSRDATLETKFSALEGQLASLLHQIGDSPTAWAKSLSDTGRSVLDEYIYYQWKRVPDVHEAHFTNFDDKIDETLEDFAANIRPLTGEEQSLWQSKAARSRLHQNVLVKTLESDSLQIRKIIGTMTLRLARTRNTKYPFLIGSNPTVRRFRESPALQNRSTEIWLPISAADCLIWTWAHSHETISLPPKGVRHVNAHIAAQSSQIASANRETLKLAADDARKSHLRSVP